MEVRTFTRALLMVLLVFVSSCVSQPVGMGGHLAFPDGGTDGAGDSGFAVADGGPMVDAGPVGEGLPCDVATFFETKCDTCHTNPPAGGAPVSLLTYADLQAPSRLNPALNEAQESLVRVESTSSPMPPGGGLSASDVAVLANWLDAGTPQGTCAAMAPDAGSPDSPPVCTSNSTWTGGNDGSSRMNPGLACIACHQSTGGEAPRYSVAGTVYPTVHEPDLCNGASGSAFGVTVHITDAAGTTITLTPNSAGNFDSSAALTFPIRASVTSDAGTLVMQTPQSSGDCNSCHTQNGLNGAPGRIIVP